MATIKSLFAFHDAIEQLIDGCLSRSGWDGRDLGHSRHDSRQKRKKQYVS